MKRGQDNGGPARDNVPTRAAVIEDEPASDFYASLVGVKTSPGSRKRRRILPLPQQPNSKHGPSDNTHLNHNRSEIPAASLPIVDAEVDDTKTSECSDDQKSPGPALKSEMGNSLHRAFANPPTNQTSLSLDKSNKGYAMLSAMGWSEESGGLGRSRQGDMLPVKTTLKMDKRGLGLRLRGKRSAQGTAEARITHRHDDIEAAAGRDNNSGSTLRGETKAERKKRKKQEADKASREDRRVRMMLRSDIPPEYEELYMRLHK